MAVDFSKFKKNSASNFDRLNAEIEKMKKGGSFAKDEREWQPTVDQAGNGFAIIRFLPACPTEEIPFVRVFRHAFKGPLGTWYIENSLTTIGQDDPVGESNSKLWNSGVDANKAIARDRKRKLTFISNIFVVKDAAKPENEGKVFLYKYGKKIYDKVESAAHPAHESIEAFDPFDLWKGANFNLIIKKVEGYRNYDDSKFANCSPLFKDDKKLEAIWKSEYPLQPFLAADQFKSYVELQAKLNKVLGLGQVVGIPGISAPTFTAPASEPSIDPADTEADPATSEYFAKMAQED